MNIEDEIENIIIQLEEVDLNIQSIEDEQYSSLNKELSEYLNTINVTINKIKQIVSTYNISSENKNRIFREMKIEKMINKCLFPQFWALDELLKNVSMEQLDELENNYISSFLETS